MNLRVIIALVLAAFLSASCNNSDFAGGGEKKASANSKPNKDKDKDKDKPKKPGKPGNDSGPDDAEDLGQPADPGTNDDPGNPDPGNLVDDSQNNNPNPNNDNDTSIFDILGALLDIANDVAVDQPNENEIVFGGDKVFHIGDGNMSGSSCLEQITSYNVAGVKYFFEFEVKKPDTQVSINIERICGVDYGDTNFAYIAESANPVGQQQNISSGAFSLNLQSVTLGVGRYQLIVESRNGSQQSGSDPNDFDDFIVGKIDIRANKPIKPGRVGAN